MKLLIACLNANGFGGSELYHLELVNALATHSDYDITFATLTPRQDTYTRSKINREVTQINIDDLTESYDLIVASQPQVLDALIRKYPKTPKIAIIHSVIRSEDPVYHPSIVHYIAVQPDIYRELKKHIPVSKIELFYNPIDFSRFNPSVADSTPFRKFTVLFVGNWDDRIRNEAAINLMQNCIEQDWNCWFVCSKYHNFNHPNIRCFDQVYETEMFLRYADVTAGIGGRNTIEGWACGKPSFIYSIHNDGRIKDVRLVSPPKMDRFNSINVAKQHIALYKSILNN